MECVELRQGEVLCDAGDPIGHAYFPTTAVLSLIFAGEDGESLEIGAIGNEGVLGVALVMGRMLAPNHVAVQLSGLALRMHADELCGRFESNKAFHDSLLNYEHTLTAQISQVAVCNQLHALDCRLSRWLLAAYARTHSAELVVTHEFIAGLLGVRRASISIAANRLQDLGLIRYGRGRVRILNPADLQQHGCECCSSLESDLAFS